MPGVMVVTDRPNPDTSQELWSRAGRIAHLNHRDCCVTSLLRRFGMTTSTAEEIARDEGELYGDLEREQPQLIIAVGKSVTQWFLPQFADESLDRMHGLTFEYRNSLWLTGLAWVIPIIDPWSALKEPDRYQGVLTDDWRAVARWFDSLHVQQPITPVVHRVGLASVGKPGALLGLDTEGYIDDPQAITLAVRQGEAALLDVPAAASVVNLRTDSYDVRIDRMTKWGNPFHIGRDGDRAAVIAKHAAWIVTQPVLIRALPELAGKRLGCHCAPLPCHGETLARLACRMSAALQPILNAAGRITIHHAKHDWQVLHRLGLTLPPSKVDDTMLMAYALGLPQSLKVLAWRLLGYVMSDYADLIRPLDDALVRRTLEDWYGPNKSAADSARELAGACERLRRVQGRRAKVLVSQGATRLRKLRAREAEESAQAEVARLTANGGTQSGEAPAIPRRSFTSVRAILDKSAEATLRERWSGSSFSGLIPLPPEPSWRDVPREIREPYAMTDAVAHVELAKLMKPMLQRDGLRQSYAIDRAILPFLVRNEEVGMKVDVAAIQPLTDRLNAEYEATLDQLEALVGFRLNPLAAADVSECLFTQLGVSKTKRGKGGNYTTGKKHLLARKNEHAAIPLIMHARHLSKLTGTYTEKLPAMLRNGRYHADWKYTRTDTGRAAESMILLVPKDSELSKPVRNLWIADEDCVLVAVDLSAIEMRVAADLSRDELMLKVFREGGDPHADTAHRLLGAPAGKENQDDALHRKPSKILNFGVLMQMTEVGLNEQFRSKGLLHWTEASCKEFLDGWYAEHRGYAAYVQRMQANAERDGYVRSLAGRRMRVDGVWSTDHRIRRAALRQAAALPIQSSAIEIAKQWIAAVWREVIAPRQGGTYCEPFVWVHDDITLCCHHSIAGEVEAAMLALVPQVLCVPTLADAKQGQSWGSLH